jgi:hypothetical protein
MIGFRSRGKMCRFRGALRLPSAARDAISCCNVFWKSLISTAGKVGAVAPF